MIIVIIIIVVSYNHENHENGWNESIPRVHAATDNTATIHS